MATTMERFGGRKRPIQIQAEVLRRPDAIRLRSTTPGFMMPPEEPPAPDSDLPPWRDTDLKRAIGVAQDAGLQSYRVEIAPDGTISIVVGSPAPGSDGADPA